MSSSSESKLIVVSKNNGSFKERKLVSVSFGTDSFSTFKAKLSVKLDLRPASEIRVFTWPDGEEFDAMEELYALITECEANPDKGKRLEVVVDVGLNSRFICQTSSEDSVETTVPSYLAHSNRRNSDVRKEGPISSPDASSVLDDMEEDQNCNGSLRSPRLSMDSLTQASVPSEPEQADESRPLTPRTLPITSEDEEIEERPSANGDGREQSLHKQRPPRPQNAFILFSNDRRPVLRELHKDLPNLEISRILGEEWKRLDPVRKRAYVAESSRLRELFNAKYPDYVYTRRPSRKRKAETAGTGSGAGTGASGSHQAQGWNRMAVAGMGLLVPTPAPLSSASPLLMPRTNETDDRDKDRAGVLRLGESNARLSANGGGPAAGKRLLSAGTRGEPKGTDGWRAEAMPMQYRGNGKGSGGVNGSGGVGSGSVAGTGTGGGGPGDAAVSNGRYMDADQSSPRLHPHAPSSPPHAHWRVPGPPPVHLHGAGSGSARAHDEEPWHHGLPPMPPYWAPPPPQSSHGDAPRWSPRTAPAHSSASAPSSTQQSPRDRDRDRTPPSEYNHGHSRDASNAPAPHSPSLSPPRGVRRSPPGSMSADGDHDTDDRRLPPLRTLHHDEHGRDGEDSQDRSPPKREGAGSTGARSPPPKRMMSSLLEACQLVLPLPCPRSSAHTYLSSASAPISHRLP